MAVIVNEGMAVDAAMRMLWRESSREGIVETLKENRYYVKPTAKRHEVTKKLAKTKRRHAAMRRKFANRGWAV